MDELLKQASSTIFILLADLVISFICIALFVNLSNVRAKHIRIAYLTSSGLTAASSASSFIAACSDKDLWTFFMAILVILGMIKLIISLIFLIFGETKYAAARKKEKAPVKNHNDQTELHEIVYESVRVPVIEKENPDRFTAITIRDFAALGWNKWDSKVHQNREQYNRILRANDPRSGLRIFCYSRSSGHAIVSGSKGRLYLVSGNGCSCRDFHEWNRPCKHMYYLASNISLPDFPDIRSSDFFYGLRFAISGGPQDKIKAYIKQHKGRIVESVDMDTTALVLKSEKPTKKLTDAQIYHVELLTFDDLQTLFEKPN